MQPARPSFLEYFEQKEKENVQNDVQNQADNRRPEGDLQVVSPADRLLGLLVSPVPVWTGPLWPWVNNQICCNSTLAWTHLRNQMSSVVDLQQNAFLKKRKEASPWQRRDDARRDSGPRGDQTPRNVSGPPVEQRLLPKGHMFNI